ncbi:branched-chain amino acid ABC transporter permease [Stigmatella erecta]|uniref:Amino acid/amide ABC transporter membrane protein 2, HAAT family n=1 Tax=Stigmatella erecta TaxID=83460 RepID=A0A1I0L704_9BACT|nr:branched-chain amino acid ABC transporter permease [Stigmatella erecta]SEU35730.1 amino acid/amide ABC transporter membrane protein 2, HAAT family [Stigmatella erecta]
MTGYLVTLTTLVAIASLTGLALNLQWGAAGMANFGLAGFYALSAYACGLVSVATGSPLAGLGAALAVSFLASGLVALVSLRLEEDYLAIVTLGFAELTRLVILNEGWLTQGALGLAGIPRPLQGLLPGDFLEFGFLALTLLVLLAVFLVLERLGRSPFGRALRAVREDDVVAATLGKRVLWLRVRAFALGGAITGLAGALHAFYYTYIDPSQFSSSITAYAFMAVIAGGRNSNRGLLLGAFTLMVLLEGTRFLKDAVPFLDSTRLAALRLILIGGGLVALLIYRPQGFLPEYRLRLARKPDPGSPQWLPVDPKS